MIQRQLKLRLTIRQEKELERWIWHLTGVYNWAIRKIELDAKDRIYHSRFDMQSMLRNHSKKIGVLHDSITETAMTAYTAWDRCFKKVAKRPGLKGNRNKLNSIPFRKNFRIIDDTHINVYVLGVLKFHKQDIPAGKIKVGRIIKRASGWFLCLTIDAQVNEIPSNGNEEIGIDPGFNYLLTLSTGEKIEHPRELEVSAMRLGQAQRGINKRLVARIHERIANQRKDRNHKLSRRLVSENRLIAFSADKHALIAKRFGKSVSSSGHYQLRSMLAYKSSFCGRQYIEVSSKNSTRSCSSCGALSGPFGLHGLKVRHWVCSCGAEHDRDVNAAINTLNAGRGIRHEITRKSRSETPRARRVQSRD